MKPTKSYSDSETLVKVISIGAVAGLRAMMPAALLSIAARHRKDDGGIFASSGAAAVLGLLAVGELVGDKLPTTPNRTEPMGLAARIVTGAIGGGVISSQRRKSVPLGIALGALTAVAAAYAGQNIRRAIAEETGIHSSFIGAVEDAIAIGIGTSAVQN